MTSSCPASALGSTPPSPRAWSDEGQRDRGWSARRRARLSLRGGADLPRALQAWIRAGMAAETVYAFSDAQAYFERALELWDRVPDAADQAPLDRVELLRHAAEAAEGRSPARSVAHIRTAIALVDETTEPVRAGLLYERLGQYAIRSHPWNGKASPRIGRPSAWCPPSRRRLLERSCSRASATS